MDYYIIPEVLWEHSKCPLVGTSEVLPQEMFAEQVVLLEGTPPLHFPRSPAVTSTKSLESRFLIPDMHEHHVYLFPGSVASVHPEFDAAIKLLLRTDPMAVVNITWKLSENVTLNHFRSCSLI